MNTFVNNINSGVTSEVFYTENGALTNGSSGSSCLDLFFEFGASRNKDITQLFSKAYLENADLATRILLYGRDAREGVGERETFRKLVKVFETFQTDSDIIVKLIAKIIELGRWDDLTAFEQKNNKFLAYKTWWISILKKDGLACKWAPRKGPYASEFRSLLRISPKEYRKAIVAGSNTVEQLLCARTPELIELEKVPSVAAARYRKAFARKIPEKFTSFVEKLNKGEAKVHASAVFPHDVIRDISSEWSSRRIDNNQRDYIVNQWNSLPDFIGNESFIPMIDVSGSMEVSISGSVKAIDVALGLGLYAAERNKSAFKDCFLQFSTNSRLDKLEGNIVQKLKAIDRSSWSGSTDIQNAFRVILNHAINNRVSEDNMPKTLVIFSDMEFNACIRGTNYDSIRDQYESSGYKLPKIVFWNLNSRGKNIPVKMHDHNTMLVSGFSPAIAKSVLNGKASNPYQVMLDAVSGERYSI